ncbi:hypothetical protein AAIH32_10350 [Pseudarthrobacter oxydans]|uniref:hypothetical protein n=1 Tax=Pseudarthrobacter oxydans TaxID=1671 RepID=UPI003D29B35F
MTDDIHVRGRQLAAVLGTVTQVYTTASEMLGHPIGERQRAKLWSQVSDEQVLFLVAKILADIDLSSATERPEVDVRWAKRVSDKDLRDRLLVSTHLGSTLFAPQLLLLAVREALANCPPGPPTRDTRGLDLVVRCLLGIGDEASSTRRSDNWGGLPGGLAGEMIANQNFNRSVNIGHQLTWIDRAWFQRWPYSTRATETAGGQPWELFEEATGVQLEDFATVAINLYIRASRNVISSPDFDSLGLPNRAIEHFIGVTSRAVSELRSEITREVEASSGSLYAFNALRRFPLVRLRSGEILTLRAGFLVERAMSEVTYFDVRDYLSRTDKANGTKRDEAFKSCTNDVLEYEAGVTLQRMFSRSKNRVLCEKQLQRLFSSKTRTASVCDYAIRQGSTWLLIEVTDRAIPGQVVFGQASATSLDDELDRVLTDRKARQLASTIHLLRKRNKTGNGRRPKDLTFIPLVLTAPAGLGWNTAVHQRVKERLRENFGLSEEFAASVALITLKDLRILENAAEQGQDVLKVLLAWRKSAPGDSLDNYLLEQGISLGAPEWEKRRASQVVDRFVKRMNAAKLRGFAG